MYKQGFKHNIAYLNDLKKKHTVKDVLNSNSLCQLLASYFTAHPHPKLLPPPTTICFLTQWVSLNESKLTSIQV